MRVTTFLPPAGLAGFALLAMIASAAEPKDYVGTWVMHLGSRNLFVLTLAPGSNGVRGTLDRPTKLFMADSRFWNLGGGIRQDKIVRSHFADGVLYLTTQNPTDTTDEDTFSMTVKNGRAKMILEDLPPGLNVDPLLFEHNDNNAKVATDWNPDRTYFIDDSDIPNAEMKAIFDEDQRVRSTGKIDWAVVNKSDTARREQTRKLLADGALHTGKDFEEASFIFQHGDKADDYLLAHTLAMVAVAKGDESAIWIAAATLDRYLEDIKQKQIFDTQYSSDSHENWTQEPYDRNLVSDALRRQLGVPNQAAQTKQLEVYQNKK
jgi:hypothetical protein